ncbi:MAG TPA: hypothetical protein VNE71_12370 [Myxococcota bacterium]|nr:hypothetical protein [Myxococcota bacterium]
MKRTGITTAIALLAFTSFGCGAGRLVGLNRPAPTSVPPSAAFTPPEPPQPVGPKKPRGEKQRDAKRTKEEARPTDALSEAKLRATEQPGEPWWPYRVAELEAKSGRREASEAALRDALGREPGYGPALTSISKLLYVQGRHEEAVALLAPVRDGSIVMDEDDRAAAIAGLALHEAALGRDDHARAALAALEKSGRGGALAVSAYLAVRGTDQRAALDLTEAAVRSAPRSAAAHNNRGIALLRAADPEQAEKEFETAIALDPTLPGPWYNLAILERFYRMDHAKAAQRFQQYWARSHDDPDSLYAELSRTKPTPVAEDGGER